MEKKILTISDIAKISGVAKSTVSRVINNSGKVSEETRAKVLSVIEEYNFVPNAHAKVLSHSSSDTIGVFAGNISNQYFQELVRGIESVILESRFFPLICLASTPERQEHSLDILLRRRAAGVIIASTVIHCPDRMKDFMSQIPAVAIQTYHEGLPVIGVNDFYGGYDMAKYLHSMGHRKFGYIETMRSIKSTTDRFNGFKTALLEEGVPEEDLVVVHLDSSDRTTNCLRDLLRKRVTVIQCVNDNIAIDAYQNLKAHGLRIPEDISLSGYDDLPNDILVTPAITTVRQPLFEMGQLAAKTLFNMIDNGIEPPLEQTLETELVIRDSVKRLM